MLNTTSPTIWGRPHIVSLEEQFVKARSSMALRTYLIPYSNGVCLHIVGEGLLILAFRGKICPGSSKMIPKILVGKRFNPDDLVFSGSMDEIPISGVDPHMRDPILVLAEEKNQVTHIEVFL